MEKPSQCENLYFISQVLIPASKFKDREKACLVIPTKLFEFGSASLRKLKKLLAFLFRYLSSKLIFVSCKVRVTLNRVGNGRENKEINFLECSPFC